MIHSSAENIGLAVLALLPYFFRFIGTELFDTLISPFRTVYKYICRKIAHCLDCMISYPFGENPLESMFNWLRYEELPSSTEDNTDVFNETLYVDPEDDVRERLAKVQINGWLYSERTEEDNIVLSDYSAHCNESTFLTRRLSYKWSYKYAMIIATIRFLFLHLLQPITYLIVLSIYWSSLYELGRCLAMFVAVREVLFLFTIFYGLKKEGAYLLVNIQANAHPTLKIFSTIAYIAAIETFVSFDLIDTVITKDNCFEDQVFNFMVILMNIGNVCGIVGFIDGVWFHYIPLPLMMGFGVSFVGLIAFWTIGFYVICKSRDNDN